MSFLFLLLLSDGIARAFYHVLIVATAKPRLFPLLLGIIYLLGSLSLSCMSPNGAVMCLNLKPAACLLLLNLVGPLFLFASLNFRDKWG